MISDSIKRSDAIEAIECVDWYHQNRNKDMVSGANSDEHQAWYKAQDIYEALEAVPSADRPQGEWTYHMDEVGNVKTVSCALCGGWVDITIPEQTAKFAYCPYCGAQMKGADDE